MTKDLVPRGILRPRLMGLHPLEDNPRYRFVDGVRTLKKWLADPNVEDNVREGDAALLT